MPRVPGSLREELGLGMVSGLQGDLLPLQLGLE